MNGNDIVPISTVISDAPQVQTVVQDGLTPVSSIVNAPWVQVTSVNGQVGDVIITVQMSDYNPSHFYQRGDLVLYDGGVYFAKEATSGGVFNPDQWGSLGNAGQVQVNWNENDPSQVSYILNKPTRVSQFENDADYANNAQVDSKISTSVNSATRPIIDDLAKQSAAVSDLEANLSGVSAKVDNLSTSLENKVDKQANKGLSTNDFTNQYKDLLDGLKTTILNQVYPVGSIYTSTSLSTAAQVNSALGGTWEAYGSGRVLVGYDSSNYNFYPVGYQGGNESSSSYHRHNTLGHTLTTDEIPSHQHGLTIIGTGSGPYGYNVGSLSIGSSQSERTQAAGGGGSHSHGYSDYAYATVSTLQPYVVVYMYRRLS